MTKIAKYAAMMVGAMFLTGCFGTKIIYKDKYVGIPDELIPKCKLEKPPAKKDYVTLDEKEKENVLTNFANKQTTNAGNCAATVEKVRDWDQKQRKIYTEEKK